MTKDMRKFLGNFLVTFGCVLALIVFMILSGIFIIGCQYEDNYEASLIDKVKRLKSITIPKIILVGNSNLSFGMNSEMIEDELNMPVVNLGLHGGLGNAFHENIAKLNLNSGDIVIVCHSTYSDDNKITDLGLCWITLEYHKELWEILRPEDYYGMAKAFPKYWFRALLSFFDRMPHNEHAEISSYSRRAFNKYGDVAVKPEKGSQSEEKIFWSGREKVPAVNSTCISRLNEFNHYAKQKGATLLIASYPISCGKYSPPAEDYASFQKELASRLDCEIISDFRDYFMPYSCFYDFTLHLNEKGTKLRTLQLIKDIKKWQANKK